MRGNRLCEIITVNVYLCSMLGGSGGEGSLGHKAVRAGLQMHRRCRWCPTETPLPGQCVLPLAAVSVG